MSSHAERLRQGTDRNRTALARLVTLWVGTLPVSDGWEGAPTELADALSILASEVRAVWWVGPKLVTGAVEQAADDLAATGWEAGTSAPGLPDSCDSASGRLIRGGLCLVHPVGIHRYGLMRIGPE